MNYLHALGLICLCSCLLLVQARLGTRCLSDSECEADTECCVVSSYVVRRGKCAPRLREGTRCKVGASRLSPFWDLPYACGCGYGTNCVEETWQDSAFPGVDLKRDRCRGSKTSTIHPTRPTRQPTTTKPTGMNSTQPHWTARPTPTPTTSA